MYFLLSPAKNLNEKRDFTPKIYSQPPLLAEAEILMNDVRPLAPQQIAELMHVSDKIALLNVERNQKWQTPFTTDNAKEISYIHNHVRILSGLYGILRPLDLIQPYRLEMGTPLKNSRGKNLYEFWGSRVTERLNYTLECSEDGIVVNLASQEYFKVLQPAQLNARIITPVFKDAKGDGAYKVISFYAKRARGLMVRYAAQNAVEDVEQLKQFDLEGYAFNEAASTESEWVFLRRHEA